jgi:hypothetical protein
VNIDDALTAYRGDLINAAQRWHKTRARRRQRIALVTSALALAGIIVGTALAATGWLVGSPAPKSVKSDFGSYAPQLGFNPEPGKAVLVATDSPYKLYVTTNKQGGYCTLTSAPWKRPGPHGEGGDCISRKQASVPFSVGMGGAADAPNGGTRLVLIGRTRARDATQVRFTAPEGKTITATVGRSGFFIVGFIVRRPANSHASNSTVISGFLPGICRWTPTFNVLDANGGEVTRKTLTFGPRVCFRPPKPVVKTENGTETFILDQGMIGYLAKAAPGDRVTCRGGGHALTLVVPKATVGTHRRTGERRLQLNIRHARDGRIWVLCQ